MKKRGTTEKKRNRAPVLLQTRAFLRGAAGQRCRRRALRDQTMCALRWSRRPARSRPTAPSLLCRSAKRAAALSFFFKFSQIFCFFVGAQWRPARHGPRDHQKTDGQKRRRATKSCFLFERTKILLFFCSLSRIVVARDRGQRRMGEGGRPLGRAAGKKRPAHSALRGGPKRRTYEGRSMAACHSPWSPYVA